MDKIVNRKTFRRKTFRMTAKIAGRIIGAGVAMAALSACVTDGIDATDGLEFRQARYSEMMRAKDFQSCKQEALEMDRQARSRDSAGAYLASAKVMEGCEAGLGSGVRNVSQDERMRLNALAVLNYLKGGDAEKASRSLAAFNAKFPNRDLYFADGSSFVETVDILLRRSAPSTFGAFAALNVNRGMKVEMRRLNHWKDK